MVFAPSSLKSFAYVSQFNETVVNEYAPVNKKNPPPLCQITGQSIVNGIGVDAAENLWVPAGGDFRGTLTEFAPNCGAKLFSINDTNGQAAGIAFDRKHNIYLLNIVDSAQNGNIDVYAPGATQPKTVLQDTQSFRFFDEAIDAAGNVYVAWADFNNKGHLDEFAGGSNPVTHLSFSFGFPGGLTLDPKGNLLVIDDDALRVEVLAPPFTGNPVASFPIKGASSPCRFTRTGTELYCSDYAASSVDAYRYDAAKPSATSYLYSFNNGITPGGANAGLAISPAQRL